MLLVAFILLFVPAVVLSPPPFAVYSLDQGVVSIYSGNSEGQLSNAGQITTNGTGSGSSGLQSQNGIIVFQNYIFAVNAGSNSVSMFQIQPTDPTVVVILSTVDSGGDWPLSLTAYGNTLCVINGGARNGIRCFTITSSGLVFQVDLRLNLTLTTPPANHMGPAQISFTNNGDALVVSVKGLNPPVWVFPYYKGVISKGFSTPAHGAVSFGFTFDTDDTVILTDASPYNNGSGLILINPSTASFLSNYYLIPGQNAACWVVRSSQTSNFYVANAATSTVSEISRSSGNSLTLVNNYYLGNTSHPTDMTIATVGGQDWLFVVVGSSITTLKLVGPGNAVIMGSVSADSVSISSYVINHPGVVV